MDLWVLPLAMALDDLVFNPAGASSAAVFVGDIKGPVRASADGRYLPLPDFISCAGGLEARPDDLLRISAYPFVSDDFDAASRADLMRVTTKAQAYTLGGRFEPVMDASGQSRQISWQTGNNGPWLSVALYDPVSGAGFAAMTTGDSSALAQARDEWLARQGLTRLPRTGD